MRSIIGSLLPRLRRIAASAAGFSATEPSVVVVGMSVLAGTAGPHLQEYLDAARLTKAQGDVRVLAISIVRLMNDVGQIGARGGSGPVERPSLLASEGEIPEAASPEFQPWLDPLDGRRVQSMAAHLVDNSAGYPTGSAYRRWRGPYVERLSADPWGCRYAVNVATLAARQGLVTVVVSPGPNKILESPFQMTGMQTSGDDVVGLVWSGW